MSESPFEATSGALLCSECNRSLEWCSFCDSAECRAAVCYRCLVIALGESVGQPHQHGG